VRPFVVTLRFVFVPRVVGRVVVTVNAAMAVRATLWVTDAGGRALDIRQRLAVVARTAEVTAAIGPRLALLAGRYFFGRLGHEEQAISFATLGTDATIAPATMFMRLAYSASAADHSILLVVPSG
jgi:hypothetical protein